MLKLYYRRILIIFLFLIIFLIIIKFSDNNVKIESGEFEKERSEMVEQQLKIRDITDKNVLEVMGKVPRHEFVPKNLIDQAYEDHPVPIGYGQTISQPYIVALMTQELDIKPGDKVLEIGTGSGYQAAILNEITDKVFTIEIVEELAKSATDKLNNLGYKVEVRNADGYFGWEEESPFDKIIVTAAVDHIPPQLLKQLKDSGKLIIPLGDTLRFQTLTLITKNGNDTDTRFITGVRFVPLTGEAMRK